MGVAAVVGWEVTESKAEALDEVGGCEVTDSRDPESTIVTVKVVVEQVPVVAAAATEAGVVVGHTYPLAGMQVVTDSMVVSVHCEVIDNKAADTVAYAVSVTVTQLPVVAAAAAEDAVVVGHAYISVSHAMIVRVAVVVHCEVMDSN